MVMNCDEYFENIKDIYLQIGQYESKHILKQVRKILCLICDEKLKDENFSIGSLFAKIDYLCIKHKISTKLKFYVQRVRSHTHHSNILLTKDDLYIDLRAVSEFVSRLYTVDIPLYITNVLPFLQNADYSKVSINNRYMRVCVQSCDDEYIYVVWSMSPSEQFRVKLKTETTDHTYLIGIVHEGSQLNLLENHTDGGCTILSTVIVFEPDFLIDISALAGCFEQYGHHPFNFYLNKFKSRTPNQSIILGNFSDTLLNEVVHCENLNEFSYVKCIKNFFAQYTLDFAICEDFDPNSFKIEGQNRANNLKKAVAELSRHYDLSKVILEPSFICEHLGVQGRVDLMTIDSNLLIEQKSGKNGNIEKPQFRKYDIGLEKHVAQILLYYGVLRNNFQKNYNEIAPFLLYSKYDPSIGLVLQVFRPYSSADFESPTLYEVMKFRNSVVALNFRFAENGIGDFLNELSPELLNVRKENGNLYNNYLLPEIVKVISPLKCMSHIERDYFSIFFKFIMREQLEDKLGAGDSRKSSYADMWLKPVESRIESGDIFMGLTIKNVEKSEFASGYDRLHFYLPKHGDNFLPSLRMGDIVYVYTYNKEPIVTKNFLFSGTLIVIKSDEIVVKLAHSVKNPAIFKIICNFDDITGKGNVSKENNPFFAIERQCMDTSINSSLFALHSLMTSPKERRDLLLSQREPRLNKNVKLTRSYDIKGDKYYDDILLKAKQATDYFLLVGPPGTGKTHRAIRYMVEEELTSRDACLLIMAYTNRAVDELCSMLTDELGVEYIRLGKTYSCDEKYRRFLLNGLLESDGNMTLQGLKDKLNSTRIVVGTVAYLNAKPFILGVKQFSLAIIDESSQLLETNVVGILSSNIKDKNRCDIDKFILVGDYKQLPAVVAQKEKYSKVSEISLNEIGLSDCRNSLFYRLVRHELNCERHDFVAVLNRQGRMHPEIFDFPGCYFYEKENIKPVPVEHQTKKELQYVRCKNENFLNKILSNNRLVFFDCKSMDDITNSDKINKAEAELTTEIYMALYKMFGDSYDMEKSIGIIVPYRNQISLIRKRLVKKFNEANLDLRPIENLTIDTVERYQGSQRDVIIYSFTISKSYQLDFLTSNSFMEDGKTIDPKLNVAMTRAREQLIMLGDSDLLASNYIFSEMIKHVKGKNGFFDSVEVKKNHF